MPPSDPLHPPGDQPPAPGATPPPYEPFQQYYAQPATPPQRKQRNGLMGYLITVALAVWGVFKYAFILIKLVPGLPTLLTIIVSFALYAKFYGFGFAAGIIVMLFVHEMGHVIEIRRQGLKATAPLFIPFLGAAIFQRQHAQGPLKQAEIGIAGPIAGTIGATAAFVLYGATHWDVLLLWAWLGFYINLFNLIPFGMLDGGWILAPVSKWFQLGGLAVMVVAVVFFHFTPILLLIIVLGLFTLFQRFRNPALDAYYAAVPASARLGMGIAWLVLVFYLGFASFEAHKLLDVFIR